MELPIVTPPAIAIIVNRMGKLAPTAAKAYVSHIFAHDYTVNNIVELLKKIADKHWDLQTE